MRIISGSEEIGGLKVTLSVELAGEGVKTSYLTELLQADAGLDAFSLEGLVVDRMRIAVPARLAESSDALSQVLQELLVEIGSHRND